METERGTDDESIRFYAETIERIHKDLDKEIRVAAKERTLRLRQNALVPEIKEEGILSEASKMLSFIIQAEKNYYTSEKNYIDFDFGNDCKPIGFVHPENAHYEYAFKGDKALARERIDVNNDGDTDDGITLSVNEVEGILSGSSLKGNNEVSSGTIHKSLKISILENGDYEIDGKRVSPSQLEQALIENKDKISDPKTIMEIQFKTTSEKEKPSGYYLLIKTIQKIGINIDTSNVEKSFPE
ncbi:hypothetical protein LLG96_02475 [bacterium]|nr:hypothetical protein [bacterium]